MRRHTAIAGISMAAAAVLLVSVFGGGGAARSAIPTQTLCRSGYVDAVVGGENKCLHAGEFCSASAEPVYELHGFTCVAGHLQTRRAAPEPRRSLAPGHYEPPAATNHSGCRVRGDLPDPACSPGAVFATATAARVCVPGYSRSVRNVPESERSAVFVEYGLARQGGGAYEVDHLISLELGGSNAIANLWPEPASARPGFHEKDRLENRLHDSVCSGALTLRRAQQLLATNWAAAYRQLVR